MLVFLSEPALHAGFDLCSEQRDGFEEVFLGQATDVHLQEVAHVAVQMRDPFGDLVGVADVVGPGACCLRPSQSLGTERSRPCCARDEGMYRRIGC